MLLSNGAIKYGQASGNKAADGIQKWTADLLAFTGIAHKMAWMGKAAAVRANLRAPSVRVSISECLHISPRRYVSYRHLLASCNLPCVYFLFSHGPLILRACEWQAMAWHWPSGECHRLSGRHFAASRLLPLLPLSQLCLPCPLLPANSTVALPAAAESQHSVPMPMPVLCLCLLLPLDNGPRLSVTTSQMSGPRGASPQHWSRPVGPRPNKAAVAGGGCIISNRTANGLMGHGGGGS